MNTTKQIQRPNAKTTSRSFPNVASFRKLRQKDYAMVWNYLAVALGGAIGCCARYGLTQLIQSVYSRSFPLATLTINVLGSFALGFLFFETLERLTMSPALRAGILTGGLGGFTTFSTFMVESLLLVEDGARGSAVLYALLSMLLGFIGAFAGGYLSRSI